MEEVLPPYLFLTASLSLLLYFAAKASYRQWFKPKRLEKQLGQQGIRGNPYKVLYGDMKEESRGMKESLSHPLGDLTHQIVPRVMPFTHKTVQRYGKMCLLWSGPDPRVVLCDPEMVKEVFSNKSGQFKKPPKNPLTQLLSRGLSSLEGNKWAKRRKVITPAFHLEKLKRMVPAFTTSCIDLIKRWDELIGTEGSCELDVWPEFQNLSGDVISRTAFGSSFEEGKRIFQLQKEQAQLVSLAAHVPYIPGYIFIPTANNKRRMQIDKEMKTMLRAMIDKKFKCLETDAPDSSDLLGLLLQFTTTRDRKYRITVDEVIEECKLFYFAGEDTTSSLLTWTLILLSMYPVWQQRARDEVLKTCGNKTPDMESINHFKIVTMILHEVLRLYPPVISVVRQTNKETKLGEYLIPVGVGFLLPTILIHHDPEIWGNDAEEFNPERFSKGISKACKGGQNAFLPFGWGPRICIGQTFAMIEAKMALGTILQHFAFELSPSYSHAPCTVITLRPQLGAHIILHRL